MRSFNWDVSIESSNEDEIKTKAINYGDGYDQVTSEGINNIKGIWRCSKTDYKQTIDEIRNFLRSTKGVEAFIFQPVPDEPPIVARLLGNPTRKPVDGSDVWSISFTLKQVFIP